MRRSGHQRGSIELRRGLWSLRVRQRQVGEGWQTRRIRVGPSSRFRTRAAARLEADRILERLELSAPITGRAIGFSDFMAPYLEEQLSVLQPNTVSTYRSLLRRHLMPALKDTPLHEINGHKPASVIAALIKAGLARGSIRQAMGVLARLLDVARELGYASVPLNRRAYRLPPAGARTEPRSFTPEEASKIIEAADYPWRAFYALMAFAGLRCSEALGIEWQHIDLSRRQLHIRQAACMGQVKAVKSHNSAADLPIPDELFVILHLYEFEVDSRSGLLFESPQGGPYWERSVCRTHFDPLLKRLGITHGGLHAFRHGHATNLFASGASAPVVRGMLRHGDIKTTLRYTHVTGEDMRRAAAAAGKRIGAGFAP